MLAVIGTLVNSMTGRISTLVGAHASLTARAETALTETLLHLNAASHSLLSLNVAFKAWSLMVSSTCSLCYVAVVC